MTKYRIFLVSQIIFIGTSLAVPTNVEETAASTAASTPVSSAVPSSSVLPEGISESTIAAAAEILQRATDISEVGEAISIGNGTIPAEEGDGIPDDGWEYENTTYVDTRRILYSKTVEKGKRPYMVYLQLTRESAKAHKYRGWLCGGVIVDKYYVLTSAACVEDADRFYIVSGTTKFVDSFDFKNNDCVCKHRRRVVWKCIPKNYKFDFQDSIKWSSNDIAIVKVDRPFKLGVTEKGCEFATDLICINNVSRELEKPGTKGFIAGWGSGSNFREGVYRRQKEVHIPQNAKCLQEAKVCVMDNEQCAKRWAQRFRNIITQYMICTKDVMKRLSELCEKKYANCTDVDTGKSRRSAEQFEEPNNEVSTIWNVDLGRHLRDPDDYTARRASNHGGFCENDHGGPLIVKYQNKERVIGVISACKIDPKSHNCHGPFLYTSVFRNRQFISCAINKDVQENCRRVFRTGITHEEWQVSWDGFKEDDEIDMKADSKKDENEFNSDENAAGKPYLRQNDEVAIDQIVEDQDEAIIKAEDDSSSEESQTNDKNKTLETKEENKEEDEIVTKIVQEKNVKENEEKDEETEKKQVEIKESKEEEGDKETEKKTIKSEDPTIDTEGEDDVSEKKPVKIKKVKETKNELKEKEKNIVEKKETTEETEEEGEKTENRSDKPTETKEVEDEHEKVEKQVMNSKETKEETLEKEEENETTKPKKSKKDRKGKHKKNKRKSKKKAKKVKKNKEVEMETEDIAEAEVKTESKAEPVTEAVLEVIEKKTIIEDKNEGLAVNVGGDPDKAEVFYESSRDENVNDPMEE